MYIFRHIDYDEFTITDKMLSDIESSFCVLNKTTYQQKSLET